MFDMNASQMSGSDLKLIYSMFTCNRLYSDYCRNIQGAMIKK